LSPHARGLASIGAAKALQDKADMLGQRKALDHLNDWLHTGAGADPSGDNTAAQALQQQLSVALSGGQIKWPAVIKATKDFSIEQSKRSAKMQANQNARVNIGQMFFGEGGMRPMFEPGSDEDLEARSIMEQAGRGLISEPAASKQIFALKHGGDKAGAKQTGPHDSDVITLAKELHDRGEAKTLTEGIAMARKTLGPQADEQPPTGKEAQIKAAADAFEKKNGRKPTVSELKAVVEGGQPSEAAVAPVPEPPPSKPISPDIGRSMNSPRNPADAGLQARRDAQYADTHESRMTGSGHKTVEVPSKTASAAKADEGTSFARSADPYLRTLTSDELAEFRRLRREGTADERAAWLAKMKAKS
jgi:hypothetical protein